MKISLGLLTLTIASSIICAEALPACNEETVQLPTEKIVFAIIGDWGRQAADSSFFNAYTVSLCANLGQCCSSLQDNNFPDDFDAGDYGYAEQQLAAATLLDEVCGQRGCQFISGMGDNFYPCGADNVAASGINRFETDWINVYGTGKTSNIANLTWYQQVGNHDYGFDSVARQVDYSNSNSKWHFPSPYYSTLFQAKNVSVQISVLDATPFVPTYSHPTPNTAYYHAEFQARSTPSYLNSEAAAYLNKTSGVCNVPPANTSFIANFSDSATGQIPWLKSCLNGSSATWNFVTGHFALWGSDVQWGDPQSPSPSKSLYPGNCGAWGSVAHLVEEFKADLYFNGHDHTMTHADPKHAGLSSGNAVGYGNASYLVSPPSTQYLTLGNGGIIQYGDGVTLDSPKAYNNFSSVVYNDNTNGTPGEGFAIVTATPCNITVDMYGILNYQVYTSPVHTIILDKCGKP